MILNNGGAFDCLDYYTILFTQCTSLLTGVEYLVNLEKFIWFSCYDVLHLTHTERLMNCVVYHKLGQQGHDWAVKWTYSASIHPSTCNATSANM